MSQVRKIARAFAPATIGNVAVGFDILGFPIEAVGDEVEAWVVEDQNERVTIESIVGLSADTIPNDPNKNTAALAVIKLLEAHGGNLKLRLKIKKGIPLSSGLGGSAASSVAAVVSANELLAKPLKQEDLVPFALAGEALASGGGAVHGDNVIPCLLGGLRLCFPTSMKGMGVVVEHFGTGVQLPVPKNIFCVLCKPNVELETKKARDLLGEQISLMSHVAQSACLAGFVSACYSGDMELLKLSLRDLLVEPQRKILIPEFDRVKESALKAGALGCSISGAGPTIFAWVQGKQKAHEVESQMLHSFEVVKLSCQTWISPISNQGARVLV